jgi:hypothetical protein
VSLPNLVSFILIDPVRSLSEAKKSESSIFKTIAFYSEEITESLIVISAPSALALFPVNEHLVITTDGDISVLSFTN